MKCLAPTVRVITVALFIAIGFAISSLSSVTPASAGLTASLAIDADTSDGCSVIQPTANITTGTVTSVGICIVNAAGSPVNGLISLADLNVTYTAPLTASNVAGNGSTDLDSNPNWNQAIGGTWDCNSLDLPVSAPMATPSPATMSCDSGVADVAVSGNVLLATLNFDAAASIGTTTLAFGSTDLSTGVAGINNPVCGQGITCTGAAITVQAPPTATNTAVPPTATNTPIPPTATRTSTPTNTATSTPSPTPCNSGGTPVTCPTATATSATAKTHTPTPTASATATSTTGGGVPPTQPAGAAVPTRPGGGAGGVIRLPDTGQTTAGGAETHTWWWLTVAAMAAVALGGAVVLTVRRYRR